MNIRYQHPTSIDEGTTIRKGMKEYRIKAVLFDLDGVLVFTDKYHYRSWCMLAAEMGWDFDEKLNHKLRGIPRMASLQVVLDHNRVRAGEPEKIKYATMKNDFYLQMVRDELDRSDMYPGAPGFLEKLSGRNVKLALCSSSKNARMVIRKLGIDDYFQAVVSGKDIEFAKPHPQVFLKGAEMLQVEPRRCVVFEDAEAGIKAARAAGMKAIGVGDADSVPGADERIKNYDQVDVEALLMK